MTDAISGVLVGAYERDNFGDILFLHATRYALGTRTALATSPFEADTRALGGDIVSDYTDVFLKQPDISFLWTVGGEIGGTTSIDAASMSSIAARASRRSLPPYASPYLPRPSRHSSLRRAPSVVNSVGVSALAFAEHERRVEAIGALREATFLSVRDSESSRFLKRMGISHSVAPDIVHTIQDWLGAPPRDGRDVALVQLSAEVLGRVGSHAVAKALAGSVPARFTLRVFFAGEAPGHDSREGMEIVASEYRKLTSRPVEVSEALTAHDKAAEIARASLWIGTSLHGFIVATAYGVPRVGLEIQKVAQYARTWDIQAPVAVKMTDLQRAVEAALERNSISSMREARRLRALAHANSVSAIAAIESAKPATLARLREEQAALTQLWLQQRPRAYVEWLRVFKARARRRARRVKW